MHSKKIKRFEPRCSVCGKEYSSKQLGIQDTKKERRRNQVNLVSAFLSPSWGMVVSGGLFLVCNGKCDRVVRVAMETSPRAGRVVSLGPSGTSYPYCYTEWAPLQRLRFESNLEQFGKQIQARVENPNFVFPEDCLAEFRGLYAWLQENSLELKNFNHLDLSDLI